MSGLGRRALLGLTLLDRPASRAKEPLARPPAEASPRAQRSPEANGRFPEEAPARPRPPAQAAGGFSLDSFYARRAASGGPGALPSFSVKVTDEPVETSWRGCPELHPREESRPPWAEPSEEERHG